MRHLLVKRAVLGDLGRVILLLDVDVGGLSRVRLEDHVRRSPILAGRLATIDGLFRRSCLAQEGRILASKLVLVVMMAGKEVLRGHIWVVGGDRGCICGTTGAAELKEVVDLLPMMLVTTILVVWPSSRRVMLCVAPQL